MHGGVKTGSEPFTRRSRLIHGRFAVAPRLHYLKRSAGGGKQPINGAGTK